MKFVDKGLVLAVIVGLFALMPAAGLASQPGQNEYNYDPIPNSGTKSDNDSGSNGGSNNPGNPGTSDGSTNGSSNGGSGASANGGNGSSAGDRDSTRSGDSGRSGDNGKTDSGKKKKDSDHSAIAGGGSGGSSGGSGDGGTSWILWVILIAAAGLIGGLAFYSRRRGSRLTTAMVARVSALIIVVVALLWVGVGDSLAAKRAHVPRDFFGMLSQKDLTESDAARMSRGGIETYRLPIPWGSIEAERNKFDWSWVDANIATAMKNDLKVLPFIFGTPEWVARKWTTLPVRNSRQRRAWADFLRAFEWRYGPGGDFWAEHAKGSGDYIKPKAIRIIQIWNEPNFHFFASPVSPGKYARLVKQSSRVIKKVDPKAKIMLAGLYGSPKDKRGKAMKSYKFLNKLYRAGVKRSFDIAALHPYTPSTGQLKALTTRFRKVLIRHGDRRTSMAITEIGWGSDNKTVFGMGSKRKQAKQLRSGYNLLVKRRKYLRLNSVYWFAFQDAPRSATTCNFCYGTGLFTANDRAKPAWKTLVRKFTGGRP